jgi:hypothetical protein
MYDALDNFYAHGHESNIQPPQTAEGKPQVTVPKDAPKTGHPLPPGSKVSVKKKGLGMVDLHATEDGKFKVAFQDGSSETFASLSAACDCVWVKQQGFENAADYKKAKGVNKVPSGGGWKFWGIGPGKESAPVPVADAAKQPVENAAGEMAPSATTAATFPTPESLGLPDADVIMLTHSHLATLGQAPVGAKISHPDGTVFTKTWEGWTGYKYDLTDEGMANYAKDNLDVLSYHKPGAAPAAEPEAAPVPKSKLHAALEAGKPITTGFMDAMAVGTKFSVKWPSGQDWTYEKTESGDFKISSKLGGAVGMTSKDTLADSFNSLKPKSDNVTMETKPEAEAPKATGKWTPESWGPLPAKKLTAIDGSTVDSSFYKHAPTGTVVALKHSGGDVETFTKMHNGEWSGAGTTFGSGGMPNLSKEAVSVQAAKGGELATGLGFKDFAEDGLLSKQPGELHVLAGPPTASFLNIAPMGTSLMVHNTNGTHVYTKVGTEDWKNAKTGDISNTQTMVDATSGNSWGYSAQTPIEPKLAPEGTPALKQIFPAQFEGEHGIGELANVPVGKVFHFKSGDKTIIAKKTQGAWDVTDAAGKVFPSLSSEAVSGIVTSADSMHEELEGGKPGQPYLKPDSGSDPGSEAENWETVSLAGHDKDTLKDLVQSTEPGTKFMMTFPGGDVLLVTRLSDGSWDQSTIGRSRKIQAASRSPILWRLTCRTRA